MRSMTAAFSAGPARKYRAAVSMEACPSRAWICAGSAPPWRRRVAKVCRQRWGRRPGTSASTPMASTTWVMPEMGGGGGAGRAEPAPGGRGGGGGGGGGGGAGGGGGGRGGGRGGPGAATAAFF